MSGSSDETRVQAGATGRPWRLLLGLSVVAVAAGALAFATINPPPLPVRPTKKMGATASTERPGSRPPAFGDDISLPPPEVPPAPTTADLRPPSAAPAPSSPSAPSSPTASVAAGKPATESSPGGDPASLPLAELKRQAEANDLPSMLEMARRLIEGSGIAKDPQAGAGWMLRAAELGSIQAALNVGVMYESGFVVERDSSKAAQWYRRAADAGLPAAQHNLALLLRTGKGVPRDQAQAVKLLLSAAHQGMTAAMFTLADIYERGDAAQKDLAAAVAWYEVAAQFERQGNNGQETPLARSALQRSQALQRVLTPAQLRRAQDIGQLEIAKIIAGQPSSGELPQLPAPALPAPAPTPPATSTQNAAGAPSQDLAAGWPSSAPEQVRAIQQALFDLKLLRDKPDGVPGPMTTAAIRDFQRTAGLTETGEASREVYVALRQALAKRNARSPGGAPSGPPAKAPKP